MEYWDNRTHYHSPNKLDCPGQTIKAANGWRGGGRFWFPSK